ncbi:hypothetical protein OAV88_03730 [bacterium]|nr:hypothetical protein [bacterium]
MTAVNITIHIFRMSRPENNKNVTDWTIFVDPDTDEHYYSSKSKKSLVHDIPVGIKAR